MQSIKNDEKLEMLNHSCAHLMAHAVKRLYPKAKFWVGPVIEEGFYYDIDLGGISLKEEDLVEIEKEMKQIVNEKLEIVRHEVSRKEALRIFKEDEYKIDLINNMPTDGVISYYEQGGFHDLCSGPHVENTEELSNFKLLKLSGAYWKGDSKNKMLQRVYGICFTKKEDLKEHLNLLKEAEKRDHKKIGQELDLFMISEYGSGFPFFLNKGMIVIKELEDFWYEEHTKENYQFIKTPIMLNRELWELSGHWSNYKENMYTSNIEDKTFAIKPMNCPGGMLVYKNSAHSYRDFPLRVGELGVVHRHEASGTLNGLFRVRSFTQDDAHIFMTEDQIESEIIELINLIDKMYSVFNLSYEIELSTRPEEKYIGDKSVWDKSEKVLERACTKSGHQCKINPGNGAFYGPKLDFHIKDSLGRVWQCGTIQLDMNLPERFDLYYIDDEGNKKRPVMLHRVIYGSIERFLGILIEHFAGAFPLWLSPVQVNIIPISNENHLDYSNKVLNKLVEVGVRTNLDDRNESLSYRMRDSQLKKNPLTLIIGNNEQEEEIVSFRRFGSKKTEQMSIEEFINKVKSVILAKKDNI
jgi:threonyl-tRNA synthetase